MRIGRANGEDWLRLGEAAAELGVSLNTLRRWSDAGKLTCYRSPGGHRRYRRADVEALMRAEEGGGVSPRIPANRADPAAGPFAPDDLRAPLLALARVAAEGVGVTDCRISIPADGGGFYVLCAQGRSGGGAGAEVTGPGGALPAVREVLRTGRRLVIADLAATNLLERADAEVHRQRGDAAILAVPLTAEGRNRAVMELVESRAPRGFNGANVTFAEFMARQASRLISSDEDAGRQVEATLPDEAGSTQGARAFRTEELLHTLAERLRHEMGAVACDVLRYHQEADALEPVAVAAAGGAPPLRGLLYPSADFGEAAGALVSGAAVTLHDLSAEELSGPHLVRRDQGGAHSVHAAPIRLGDRVVGLLEVYSDVPERSFDRDELALVEAAAATAALALGGDGDPGVLARRVAQLDDLIAGLSIRSPALDAESLALATLQTLRAHAQIAACTLYRVDDGVAEPFPAGDAGGNPADDGRPWRLEEYAPAATAVTGGLPVTAGPGQIAELDGAGTARFLTARGLTSVVLAPVVFWDRLVGVLELGAADAEGLATAEGAAHVSADLLAVALGSGDVIDRLQRRNRDLALVVEAGLEDSARLSTEQVLHAVAQRLSELTRTPVADIYSVEGDTLRVLVSYDGGRFDVEWEGVVLPLRRYPCSRHAVESGEIAVAGSLDDPILGDEGRYSLEKWGYQAQLSMPLVSGGHVLGVVELSDYEPRDFAADLDLIRGLGQVAAHALENASLFEQVDRRNRILNELVELGALVRQTRDLTTLTRTIAERVLAAVDAANCDIYRMEDGVPLCVASFDRSGHDDSVIGSAFDLDRYPTTVAAMQGRHPLIVSSPDDPQLNEAERQAFREYGFASEVCIPLVANDEVFGLLDVYDTRERDFSEYVGFLRSAAQTIAGAFESALLVDQLERRGAVLRDIVELGAVASQARDPETVLTALAERLRDTIGAADCDIFTLQGDQLRCLVSADQDGLDASVVGRVLDIDLFPATAMAVRSGQAMAVASRDDPRLTDDERKDMAEYGYESELCIPLVSGDRVIGLIDVFDTRPRDYGEYLDFLRSVGQTAAGAIETALLLDKLERRNTELAGLVELGREASAGGGLGELVRSIGPRLVDIVEAAGCQVFILRNERLYCVLDYDGGEFLDDLADRPLDLALFPSTREAIAARTALVIESPDDPRLSDFERDLYRESGSQSEICVPLVLDERVVGLLDVYDRRRRDYAEHRDFLLRVGQMIAGAFENAELYESIKHMHLSNLKALSSALSAKDYYTLGHAARVAAYMVLLGKELGWPEELLRHVEEAAYLHDIGKIGVPDRVLLKSSGLNQHEWELMRQHPIFSADIIRPLFDDALVEGVRHHHERWTGDGYPDGLVGEQIPEIARAMCVADSYDAMSFRRPYRQGLTYDECLEELERCRGDQFDPLMTDAFRRVLERVADGRRFAAGVAREAALTITADECLVLREDPDERRPEYASLTQKLRDVGAVDPSIRWVTAFGRRGRATVILADSGDGADRTAPGTEIVTDDELVEVFAGGELPANVLFVDQWGVWVSGVAPVLAEDGSVAAVISVDIPATEGVTEVEGLRSNVAQTFTSMLHSASVQSGRSELEAITDGLTGLYSHRYFHERLSEEIERCQEQGTSLALLFCDVDDFRTFNERHGHGSGDRALRAVARVLEASVRHIDLAARYGGEEFAAILIDTDEAGALEVAERVRAGITRTQFGAGADTLSVSIGVSTCPADATFKDELVDKADWAMYLAKRRGRNKVVAFSNEHGGETPEQAAVVRPGHVAAMGELVVAREAFRQRRRSVVAQVALAVAGATGVPAGDIQAGIAAAEAGTSETESPAGKIVALAETFQALVTERPYRARISEAEALDELLKCPALTGEAELARVFEQVLAR